MRELGELKEAGRMMGEVLEKRRRVSDEKYPLTIRAAQISARLSHCAARRKPKSNRRFALLNPTFRQRNLSNLFDISV